MIDHKSTMDRKSSQLLLFIVIYISVSVFGTALLLFDTWPQPPPSAVEWLLLLLMVLPVILIGEWLSGGVLRDALLAVIGNGTLPFQIRWWRVFYYSVMCILFATTAVALLEWTRSL
jgi:hypothetical protein